jgi:hypothetical protein
MNFAKFTIISQRNVQALGETNEVILLNLDHVISVKPILIPMDDKVVDGFWIRTTNGKKYRAIDIPEALEVFFEKEK